MEEILKILEEDCRITPEQIASMTGKSIEEVKAVINECERTGIIKSYRAVIDWQEIHDNNVIAFIDVKITPEKGVGFDDIAERIYRLPEVHSVYLVSGQHDLRVVIEGKSLKEVAFFVAEELATIDRVQSTTTHFLLKRYKQDGIIFEDPAKDRRLAIAP